MVKILPVASGKGGVGKTVFTANLGIMLASMGQKVVVVDIDLGGSNLHTVLGIKNDAVGLGHFLTNKQITFEQIVHETKYPGLRFIPGDALFVGTANLQYFRKKQIIKGLLSLEADWVLLDLGAGTSVNTIDFYTISPAGIMVGVPEITAVLNLYSFLKNAYYRFIFQAFKKGDIIRDKLIEGANYRLEKDDFRLIEYIRLLRKDYPDKAEEIDKAMKQFYPKLVLNMGQSKTDINLGENLRTIVHKNLGFDMEYLGLLPYENQIEECLNSRTPIAERYPDSKWVKGLGVIAERLINYSSFPDAVFDEDDDSKEIIIEDLDF